MINVDVPEGSSGDWKIERFEVSRGDSILSSMQGMQGRGVRPGTYTRLMHGGQVIMSDTPAEYRDHMEFIRQARRRGGNVLIHGLGLGMCLEAILEDNDLRNPSKVEHVLVIEKSQDVIDLVAEHYLDRWEGAVEIRKDDAFTWKPEKGQRWTAIWHDIWPTLCTDNLSEMATLHRRFGRRCDWQGSWGKEILKRQRDQEKRWTTW